MFKKKISFVYDVKKRMKLCGFLALIPPVAICLQLLNLQTFQHEKFADKADRAIYSYLAEDRLRLLDQLHASLAEIPAWRSVLRALRDACGGDHAALILGSGDEAVLIADAEDWLDAAEALHR